MSLKIIAEIAQGYEGRPDYCRLFVSAAARAGADAVKFQVVYADDVAQPGYQYYDFYKTLEMDLSVWREIRDQAKKSGLWFFTDLSGERALEVAKAIKPDGIKIHSSNFFNRKLLREAFGIADRVFVSLGGIEEPELAQLLGEVEGWGELDRLTLLYGFQAEPTPIGRSALNRIPALRERFPGVDIGYMDHTPGASDDRVHVSAMAMALGAGWIEKHLTLSRFLEVEDYVSALEPEEFAQFVKTLLRLEKALGPRRTKLQRAEIDYRDKAVKKLVASRNLKNGHKLSERDIDFRRSASIPSFAGYHDPRLVLGRRLHAPLRKGDAILKDKLK